MRTFDLVFESYCRNITEGAFSPFESEFFYINNLKPEYIDDMEKAHKYLVIFDEGELSRIHVDFVESGTKAYFLSFLTPVIENGDSLKKYKDQLDEVAEMLRLDNTELQDIEGNPLYKVTTTIGDANPIEQVTQSGIRYLFNVSVSCVYNSLQAELGKLVPIREEERKVEISLDGGKTFKEVQGKIQFQKSHSTDLNIFPTNGNPIAQNYGKQKRKTLTMMVQRAKSGVAEDMYQMYEDSSIELNNIQIAIQDYSTSPKRKYLCTLVQAVENGEYSLFTTLSFMFEVKEVSKEVGA